MKKAKVVLGALLVAVASVSQNVLASDATDAIAAIGTEASSLASAAWPVIISITTVLISIKLFRKFMNKST